MKLMPAYAILFACIYHIHGAQIGTVTSKISYSCGLRKGGPLVQKVTLTFEYVDGLFWDAESQSLLFVDRIGASYSRYFPNSGITYTLPFDNFEGKKLSSISPVRNNSHKLVLAADRELYYVNETDITNSESATAERIMEDISEPNNILAYASIDNKGELLMGDKPAVLIGQPEPGSSRVLRVDIPSRNITTIDNKLARSSGIAFSQDYKQLYIIDIGQEVIYRYNYNNLTGEATDRKVAFNLSEHSNEMSGRITTIAVDTKRKLWIGCLQFNGIVHFNVDTNKIEQIITIPATVTNSITFGGTHLNVLFVGTTKQFPVRHPEQEPVAGAVFAISGTGARGWKGRRLRA